MLASEKHDQGERENLFSGPRLSKMDFQELAAMLLLDIEYIQPEAHKVLETPCSMEENTQSTGLQFPIVTLWPEE